MKNKILLSVVLFCALFLALQSAHAQCMDIKSKDTSSFMNEIPEINLQLQNCQPKSPIFLYRNGNFQVNVNRAEGTSTFMMTLKSGVVSSLSTGVTTASYTVTMTESDFDSFLQSTDKTQTVSDLYNNGRIHVVANGFFNKIKLWLTNFIAGFFLPKQQQIQKLAVGEICMHGGECETGNCIYESGEGADRIYRCSCDPFRLDLRDDCSVYEVAKKTKAVGDVCIHGGECETGNCVGVAGPPWIYKCSCNPFRYVEADSDGKCPLM